MKIKFREISLSKSNKKRLEIINTIIEEYQKEGYVLTLRQLYYQLVSRDVIPNHQKEYKKISHLLTEGRMAGFVDWDAIEDRLRKPSQPASFNSPGEILSAAIKQYQLPRQAGQKTYIEVWVEKDALSGVLGRITRKYHIPIMVNRGYSSVSAMYDSFQRFKNAQENGQNIKIIYLGDYDPSGLDMIRDITDRTNDFIFGDVTYNCPGIEFTDFDFSVEAIALTMDQIRQYNPPPNMAKITDTRAKDFIDKNGAQSWEVDALKPEILNTLLENAILNNIDFDAYQNIVEREGADRDKLQSLKQYLQK